MSIHNLNIYIIIYPCTTYTSMKLNLYKMEMWHIVTSAVPNVHFLCFKNHRPCNILRFVFRIKH